MTARSPESASEDSRFYARLPEGKSCVDCFAYRFCVQLIGPKYINAEATHCDWEPSRFRQASNAPQGAEGEGR